MSIEELEALFIYSMERLINDYFDECLRCYRILHTFVQSMWGVSSLS